MSRTDIKPGPGFRAELPGLDLPTLIQMTCARREPLVVRVSSYGEEGFLYSVEGRLFHANVGNLVGEEAVLRMLAWPTGDFAICDRPFPSQPTIESSTEGLLLRAAQRVDEAGLDHETDDVLAFAESPVAAPDASGPKPASVPPPPPSSPRAQVTTMAGLLQARPREEQELAAVLTPAPRRASSELLPPSPSQLARPPAPPRSDAHRASLPPPAFEARSAYTRLQHEGTQVGSSSRPPASHELPPVSLGSSEPQRPSRRVPPAPPPEARRAQPSDDVIASVRIDAHGRIVGAFGDGDQLAQLVAYVSRIAALVQADFALDPFDAMHAELAGKRVLIYRDEGALVGVTMKPGNTAQTLRQRLGV